MKWVTRDHVHMDRVAASWLIRRFIDREAEFSFVPFGSEHPLPQGEIPFGVPGVELGIHDEAGSTFRKILTKHKLDDPALDMLADIIESGIVHVFSQIDHGYTDVAALRYPEGIGLDAISQGMMFVAEGDIDDIQKSIVLYDALYQYCRVKLLEKRKPEILTVPHPQRWDVIRRELRATTQPDGTGLCANVLRK
jgi:hypothetical protein